MKTKTYTIIDNETKIVYHYNRIEWYLAFVLVFLSGIVEGIIFTYLLK